MPKENKISLELINEDASDENREAESEEEGEEELYEEVDGLLRQAELLGDKIVSQFKQSLVSYSS